MKKPKEDGKLVRLNMRVTVAQHKMITSLMESLGINSMTNVVTLAVKRLYESSEYNKKMLNRLLEEIRSEDW